MPKRTLQGVVVSDKQDKTVVVRVERRFTHPVMKKTVRSSTKFHAHDETNEFKVGDIVRIEEHRPISKLKRWTVVDGQKLQRTEAPIQVESELKAKSSKKSDATKAK
jgi:small subunit ribosomal protein S17